MPPSVAAGASAGHVGGASGSDDACDLYKPVRALLQGIASLRHVEEAMDNGAALDTWNGPSTPVRCAIQVHDLRLLELLLRKGADVNSKDAKGVSALHMAVFDGKIDCVRALLDHGADVNLPDQHGQTPLFFAPSRHVCDLLVARQADASARNRKKQSPIHFAAHAGLNDAVEWLAGASADMLELCDEKGKTPMHYAGKSALKSTIAVLQGSIARAKKPNPMPIAVKNAIAKAARVPEQGAVSPDELEQVSTSGKQAARPASKEEVLEARLLADAWEKAKRRDFAAARESLASARAQCNRPKVWMHAAQLEREDAKYEEATRLCEEALQHHPNFAKLWMVVAAIAGEKTPADLAAGGALLAKGLEHCPDSLPLWRCAADNALQRGEINAAASILERGRALHKEAASDLLWLGSVEVALYARGEEPARQVINQALTEVPLSGLLWSRAIDLSQKHEQNAVGIDALKRCENDANVIISAAKLFWDDGKVLQARKWFQRAVSLNPRLGDAWATYLAFELDVGTPEEQLEVLSNLAEAKPNQGLKWNRVAKRVENWRTSYGAKARCYLERHFASTLTCKPLDSQVAALLERTFPEAGVRLGDRVSRVNGTDVDFMSLIDNERITQRSRILRKVQINNIVAADRVPPDNASLLQDLSMLGTRPEVDYASDSSEERRPDKEEVDGCLVWEVVLKKRTEDEKFGFLQVNGKQEFERRIVSSALNGSNAADDSAATLEGPNVLIIRRINEGGLLERWNRRHPDAQVLVNDRISSVNGATTVEEMVRATRSCRIAMRISRYTESFKVGLREKSGRKLGLRFESPQRGMSASIFVSEVLPEGLVAEHNAFQVSQRRWDLALLPGMLIEAANEAAGEATAIAEELRSNDKVLLLINRAETSLFSQQQAQDTFFQSMLQRPSATIQPAQQFHLQPSATQ